MSAAHGSSTERKKFASDFWVQGIFSMPAVAGHSEEQMLLTSGDMERMAKKLAGLRVRSEHGREVVGYVEKGWYNAEKGVLEGRVRICEGLSGTRAEKMCRDGTYTGFSLSLVHELKKDESGLPIVYSKDALHVALTREPEMENAIIVSMQPPDTERERFEHEIADRVARHRESPNFVAKNRLKFPRISDEGDILSNALNRLGSTDIVTYSGKRNSLKFPNLLKMNDYLKSQQTEPITAAEMDLLVARRKIAELEQRLTHGGHAPATTPATDHLPIRFGASNEHTKSLEDPVKRQHIEQQRLLFLQRQELERQRAADHEEYMKMKSELEQLRAAKLNADQGQPEKPAAAASAVGKNIAPRPNGLTAEEEQYLKDQRDLERYRAEEMRRNQEKAEREANRSVGKKRSRGEQALSDNIGSYNPGKGVGNDPSEIEQLRQEMAELRNALKARDAPTQKKAFAGDASADDNIAERINQKRKQTTLVSESSAGGGGEIDMDLDVEDKKQLSELQRLMSEAKEYPKKIEEISAQLKNSDANDHTVIERKEVLEARHREISQALRSALSSYLENELAESDVDLDSVNGQSMMSMIAEQKKKGDKPVGPADMSHMQNCMSLVTVSKNNSKANLKKQERELQEVRQKLIDAQVKEEVWRVRAQRGFASKQQQDMSAVKRSATPSGRGNAPPPNGAPSRKNYSFLEYCGAKALDPSVYDVDASNLMTARSSRKTLVYKGAPPPSVVRGAEATSFSGSSSWFNDGPKQHIEPTPLRLAMLNSVRPDSREAFETIDYANADNSSNMNGFPLSSAATGIPGSFV